SSLVAPASYAADLAVKAPGVMAAPATWAGFYLGVHAGVAWPPAEAAVDPKGFGGAPKVVPDTKANKAGFIAGGQLGYNWQAGDFVFGVEGDLSAITGKATKSYTTIYGDPGSIESRVNWL